MWVKIDNFYQLSQHFKFMLSIVHIIFWLSTPVINSTKTLIYIHEIWPINSNIEVEGSLNIFSF